MGKRLVVAIWMAHVLLLAGLLFAIHLAVLGVALLIFEFAMGIAIAAWPRRTGACALNAEAPACRFHHRGGRPCACLRFGCRLPSARPRVP